MLNGRYSIISKISYCGDSYIYLALDSVTQKQVLIKEFFCSAIMDRAEDGEVVVKNACHVQYKALLSDYEELAQYLMRLPKDVPIVRPNVIFNENNTVYCVVESPKHKTLDELFAEKGEPFGWLDFKRMIRPIISALEKIHSDGIYHRGIAPENIFVDEEDKLLLSGFSIPAARTANSEVDATLSFGYSAPEQYSSSSWQGSWSDVYSVAAICYRALTGTTPVEWRQRGTGIEIIEPSAINKAIPDHVSQAILNGLSIELKDRYRTLEEFWCDMLVAGGGSTVTFGVAEIEKRSNASTHEEKGVKIFLSKQMIIAMLLILCVTVFSVTLASKILDIYFIVPPSSSQEEDSIPEENTEVVSPEGESSSEVSEIVMPNLEGLNVEMVVTDPLYQLLFTFEIEKIFTSQQEAGKIVSQQPKAGEVPSESGNVYLWVSKGPEDIEMPNLVGKNLEEAKIILEENQIQYTSQELLVDPADYEGELPPDGTVSQTNPVAGTIVYRNSQTVEIYTVKSVPQVKEEEDNIHYFVFPKLEENLVWPPQSSSESTTETN